MSNVNNGMSLTMVTASPLEGETGEGKNIKRSNYLIILSSLSFHVA